MKTKNIILVVLIILATNILTFFGAAAVGTETSGEIDEQPLNASGGLEVIEEIIAVLEADHIDEVDREELLENAYKGMLEKLEDTEAGYLDPDEYENMQVQTQGTYGGVGIEVYIEDDYVTVLSPISGTPGQEAGLSSGDRIISVDGVNLVGEDLNKAVNLMRGEPDTSLKLEVERPNVDAILEFEITREIIELETVEYEMLENSIGYIRLTSFSDTSGQDFKAALDTLKQEGMESLIIDLRNNPGGLLGAAVEIADLLIPEGPITHVTDGAGIMQTYLSETEGLGMPMVALVNGASVSASEVLAGALQDTGTATLVGTQTFGKASVQNIRELGNGGAVRHTVAQYKTPDKRVIHEVGLTPDLEVDPPYIVELAMKPISTSLARGDESEEVETLQKILREFGYYNHEITGYFDQALTEALEEFQADYDAGVTGEMSDMTVRLFHEKIEELRKEQDYKIIEALELLQ